MDVDEIIEMVVTKNISRNELDKYLSNLSLSKLYEFWGKMARDHYEVLKRMSPTTKTTIALPRDFLIVVKLKANSKGSSITQIIRDKFVDFLLNE